ncbi:alpha/beta hydrolase [Chryseobacterium gotjawalense]|uniref:Alpha/beta hydrolase n=1 Tax=Chryseobacterium gotjawalense TaxID=3042315 RepID=A0ABY8RDL4_9FLAO|nr:alpha/beta hydrolase [Chryseobacterium sp. wdc7]WHF52061.1 alpha/beta hydrolase [Chryseobacterium sp. wdc7]
MKLYVVSGLGADFKVLEKIIFPPNLEVIFLDWLIPSNHEDFQHYVKRMADRVDTSEPFALLGYSFGGILVQEIDKIKPAEKIVILGSIKSDKEKSRFIKFGEITRIARFLPEKMFNVKSAAIYSFMRKMVDPKNPKMMQYLKVTDPYYLKWGIEQVSNWKSDKNPKVIQILGSKDIVFPVKYSKPDYIVQNGTHLFPVTQPKQVSKILAEIFN